MRGSLRSLRNLLFKEAEGSEGLPNLLSLPFSEFRILTETNMNSKSTKQKLNWSQSNTPLLTWLSSRKFFQGVKIYCYANFFCYANFSIVFGPNFRRAKVSEGGKLPQCRPLPPPPPHVEKSQSVGTIVKES